MAAEAFSPFERASYLVASSALPQYSRWEPSSQRSPVRETTGPVANSSWSSASSNAESRDWILKSISGGSNPIASISKSSTRSDNSFRWIASLGSSHFDRSVSLLSATAEQEVGFHRAFAFDVDVAVRLELKALMEVSMCRCRDLNTVRQAVPLHPAGGVHGAPQHAVG